MTKTQEICNLRTKKEEEELKKKKTCSKNKSIFQDSDPKWTTRGKCNWRKGSRKGSIFRKCWSKMRKTRLDKRLKKSSRDLKILGLKKSIPECLKNKNPIN